MLWLLIASGSLFGQKTRTLARRDSGGDLGQEKTLESNRNEQIADAWVCAGKIRDSGRRRSP